MSSMFGFFNDMGNYESRKVGRWDDEAGGRMVSTAEVSDGALPYETAFEHPDYNDGDMVIVEAYNTRADALAGHERWVKCMTDGPLPDELRDCANAGLAQVLDAMDPEGMVYARQSRGAAPTEGAPRNGDV